MFIDSACAFEAIRGIGLSKKGKIVNALTAAFVQALAFLNAQFRSKRRRVALVYVSAVIGIWLCAALLASGTLVSSKSVSSTGVVASVGLGVYSDSYCTQSLTSIDWGSAIPGNALTRLIYVKNQGSLQVTLSLSTANWNPATANGPLTLTWNRETTSLAAGGVVAATLTLSVLSSINGISTFGMDIVLTGAT